MYRFTAGALACALLFSGSVAHAAAESSASISGLTFTLIDLDPTDDVAASFSFADWANNTSLSFSANYGNSESESYNRNKPGFLSFTRSFSSEPGGAVAYEVSISSDALSAYGAALGAGTSYSASASSTGNGYYYGNLSLSANSLLIVKAQASVFASATNAPASTSCGYYYCSPTESASASASMSLSYSYADGGSTTSGSSNSSLSVSANARGDSSYWDWSYEYVDALGYYDYVYREFVSPGFEQTFSDSKSFKATFANTTGSSQTAAFSVSAYVNGYASTPFGSGTPGGVAAAVPEPETYALVIAGLAVVGFAARRRVAS